ncbi:MAG: hypothetical protein ACOYXB_14375 [Bacteroidota bacterium]
MKYLVYPALFLLSACSFLPSMTSRSYTPGASFDYPFYDEASGIRYYVANSETELFISLNTTDQRVINSIRRDGLTLYLDTTGRKSRDQYIQYPIAGKPGPGGPPPMAQAPQQGQFEPELMNRRMPELADDALYFSNGQANLFNIKTEGNDIRISVSQDPVKGLSYNVIIPFTLLSDQGLENLDNFSVGIKGTMTGQQAGPGGGGMPPMGGGQGMMPGGGDRPPMNGGGNPMGGPGGQGGPGGPGGQGPDSSTGQIDLWFRVSWNR